MSAGIKSLHPEIYSKMLYAVSLAENQYARRVEKGFKVVRDRLRTTERL